MVTPRKSGSGELLEYLILLMSFFLENSAQRFECGNPIDSFHPLVVAPKSKWKVNKKRSKSVKTTLKMKWSEFEMSYDGNYNN